MEQMIGAKSGPSIKDSTPVVCEKCGNDVFISQYKLRKMSKLLIGTTKDAVVPIDVFVCSKCGHINEEFMPEI